MRRDTNLMRQQLDWAATLEGGIQVKTLQPEQRDIIFKFVVYFNIFEDWLARPEAWLTRKSNKAPFWVPICKDLKAETWFKIRDYNEYGYFFAERYIYGLDAEKLFDELGLEPKHIKPIVRKLLEKFPHYELEDDMLLAYMQIAYQFRNNLFHGSKSTVGLDIYMACFDKINWMMHRLLSDMLTYKFKGLKK